MVIDSGATLNTLPRCTVSRETPDRHAEAIAPVLQLVLSPTETQITGPPCDTRKCPSGPNSKPRERRSRRATPITRKPNRYLLGTEASSTDINSNLGFPPPKRLRTPAVVDDSEEFNPVCKAASLQVPRTSKKSPPGKHSDGDPCRN